MKKALFVLGLVCVVSAGSYGIITDVVISDLQVGGATADYDHVLGKLEWTGGASATLNTTDGDSIQTDVVVSVNFAGVVDDSAGGWAKASFTQVLDWQMNFTGLGEETGYIQGNGDGSDGYSEIEGLEDTLFGGMIAQSAGHLYGAAILNVTESDFSQFGGAHWEDVSGGLAKLKSETLVDAAFGDYDTDSYTSSLSALWLYADETTIPEPATMALLGLGALLLRKRRA
ncbi:MAG: PEP-CTERM sorting domain-containing protein [Planctomycetota bacterium]